MIVYVDSKTKSLQLHVRCLRISAIATICVWRTLRAALHRWVVLIHYPFRRQVHSLIVSSNSSGSPTELASCSAAIRERTLEMECSAVCAGA